MYAKVVGGAVTAFPYTFNQLRKDNPSVSFASDMSLGDLSEFGVVSVSEQPKPLFNPDTHKLVQGVPVLDVDTWKVTDVVTPLSPAELKRVDRGKDAETLKGDAQVLALLGARPTAINNYIDSNVSNLAQAKEVLKTIARALAVVSQREFN